MGLLFKRKSPSGAIIDQKRVSSRSRLLFDKDARKELGKTAEKFFTSGAKTGARNEFQGMLNEARSGGLTREEVHQGLQEMVGEGHITKDKARKLALELGLTEKRFREIKDRSEFHDLERIEERKRRALKMENHSNVKTAKEEAGVSDGNKNMAATIKTVISKVGVSTNDAVAQRTGNIAPVNKSGSLGRSELPKEPGSIWDKLNKIKLDSQTTGKDEEAV